MRPLRILAQCGLAAANQMDHRISPVCSSANGLCIQSHIGDDLFDAVGPSADGAPHESANRQPGGRQAACDAATDVAGRSGDEHRRHRFTQP